MEASNKDQALPMDIRKKDLINNIAIIMHFMMLEPFDLRPVILGFRFKQFVESVSCGVGCGKSLSTLRIELAAERV